MLATFRSAGPAIHGRPRWPRRAALHPAPLFV